MYQAKLLPSLRYEGGWLFSSPDEDSVMEAPLQQPADAATETETFFNKSISKMELENGDIRYRRI